jgi:GGDEF domain-containing protein
VIGRWNKTSFAVLMPSTPREGAGKTMERIKKELIVPIRIQATNEEINLDPCIGWTSRVNSETADALQQNALKALDIARTSGVKIAEIPQPGQKEDD